MFGVPRASDSAMETANDNLTGSRSGTGNLLFFLHDLA